MLVHNSLIDLNISLMSKKAKSNNELLKKMNLFLSNISDDTYGETMFEQDFIKVERNVNDNLNSITNFKENTLFNNTLNPRQIKELDKIKNLEKESSNIVNNIKYKIERNKTVNKAIMEQTLEELARDAIIEHNIQPENEMQEALIYENYTGRPSSDDDDDDDDNDHHQSSGGFRNRKNKTKNKKYTKKRTYKRPKKRVSKKNKTRKMKKNYL